MTERNYTVQTKINRPVSEVFEAIVSEPLMRQYFTDRATGSLVEGAKVVWSWNQWGDFPVTVKKVLTNQMVQLEIDSDEWKKTEGEGYKVQVFLEVEELDENSTMLSISEQGWLTDSFGLKGSHDNCSGWTHMAMCLKGFVEHGLDLR